MTEQAFNDRNNLMRQICEAIEAHLPEGEHMPVETEHRVQAIYERLSKALGLPVGSTWIDED